MDFTRVSQVAYLRKEPRAEHMTRRWKVMPSWMFCGVLQVRPTCEGLAKLFVWQKVMFYFTMFLPTLYIPSLPTNYKECFLERKSWKIHLRDRDCYTYNHLHISLWFSSIPTSPSLDLWEVASLNTYHTHSKCKVRFRCCWEVLEGAIHWQMQSGWIAGSKKLKKTRLREVGW